jgi:hypothetical protein
MVQSENGVGVLADSVSVQLLRRGDGGSEGILRAASKYHECVGIIETKIHSLKVPYSESLPAGCGGLTNEVIIITISFEDHSDQKG